MHRFACALLAACFSTLAFAQSAPAPLEIRFCGQKILHAYPLSTEADVQGLLLQQMTVINRGPGQARIESIDLELVRDGQAVDMRRLAGPDVETFGSIGKQIEAAPLARSSFALLCGDQLIPTDVALSGPDLAPRQALLVTNQSFAFDGRRDSLRIRVQAFSGGAKMETSVTLPVQAAIANNRYLLPVEKGVWVIKSGPSFHTHHRWAIPQEFGIDLVKVGPDGRSHKGDGTRFGDYHAYGADIIAAADGQVVLAANDQPQPTDLLLRPGETFAAFAQRTGAYRQAMIQAGVERISGNYVMIDHGNGEYGFYAHLQPGSVRVRIGDRVKAGDMIAKLGGSGNAMVEPHLHFHVCDRPTPLACAGIPVGFSNVETPFVSFAPRPVQSGDIVIAK